jgi:hypothetical protein
MKKLIGFLALSALSCGAFAQDGKMQEDSKSKMNEMNKDCFVMKDGKMMMMKHGETGMMMMEKSVKLHNGVTVMRDGNLKMADGTMKMMKEGHYVDMDGKIGMMKKEMMND